MSFEFKLDFRTLFAFILMVIGVIVILHGIYRALVDLEDISNVKTYVETFTWFVSLAIEIVGGFFLALIGTRVLKK